MTQITLSIEQALQATGLGRTKLYELLKSGDLPARKLGRRTFILQTDMDKFLEGLQSYPTQSNMVGGL